jgi:hypothetical protein
VCVWELLGCYQTEKKKRKKLKEVFGWKLMHAIRTGFVITFELDRKGTDQGVEATRRRVGKHNASVFSSLRTFPCLTFFFFATFSFQRAYRPSQGSFCPRVSLASTSASTLGFFPLLHHVFSESPALFRTPPARRFVMGNDTNYRDLIDVGITYKICLPST